MFCNVPFATIGGVVALWASGEFLSVPASVGFIALMGIAVLNGVVLISYINEVCARGTLPFREAVMEGARRQAAAGHPDRVDRRARPGCRSCSPTVRARKSSGRSRSW